MPTNKPTPGAEIWARWLIRHLKRMEATGHSPTTIASRRHLLKCFITYAREAGVPGPETLSTSILRAYLVYRRETPNSRGRKNRPRTLNCHMLAIRRFLEFLTREGIVPSVLPASVEYVKAPIGLPRDIPSDQEIRRMLAWFNLRRSTGFRDRVIMELLYSTGMRRQELLDLKMEDVDLNQGYVRIECGKGGKGRVVPLGRVAGDWIQKYILAVRPEFMRGKPDPGWLFVSLNGGKLTGSWLLYAIEQAAKGAGITKKLGPHSLRRACATEMIRHNANPYHVKELLGHEDFRSLDVYAKLTILDLKEAHRKFHPSEQADRAAHDSDESNKLDADPSA